MTELPKKYLLVVFSIAFTINLNAQADSSNTEVVHFPDTVFKQVLLERHASIDSNNDGEIQLDEAQAYAGKIDVSKGDDYYFDENGDFQFSPAPIIKNIQGIEAFTNITEFHVRDHELFGQHLDFSNNPELLVLDIGYSDFENVNLTNNTKLIELNVTGLRHPINIDNLVNLEELSIRSSKFAHINVTNNTKLKDLSIFSSEIEEIDLSNNTEIVRLSTGGAPLSHLNITNLTKLEYLEMQNSEYDSIDVSNNIALKSIACTGSRVLHFDISQNENLESFGCGSNRFTELDFSKNHKLKTFVSRGSNNKLEFVNLKNGNLANLSIEALNHPFLTEICVDDVDYAINKFQYVDDPAVFSNCDSLNTEEGSGIISVPNYFNKDVTSFKVVTKEGAEYDIAPIGDYSENFTFDISEFAFNYFLIRMETAEKNFYFTVVKQD